jgi:hypothetical protein
VSRSASRCSAGTFEAGGTCVFPDPSIASAARG